MTSAAPPPLSGGSAPTDGLIYQADVAVWAALQLVIIKKLAHELLIEPASQEDAEADVAPQERSFEATAPVSGYRLVIQAKRFTGDPWRSSDLERLLNHGTARVPAGTRLLADPHVRYLLVTSADVNGPRELLVTDFDEWPPAADIPITFQSYTSAGRSRFAVLGIATDWTVEHHVLELLRDVLKVPHDHLQACRLALRWEALLRGRAQASGTWSREEIWAVLKAHDAHLSSYPDLDEFVPPQNWADLLEQAQAGAVLITGPSGAGKTLAALKLCEALHASVPGLKRIDVTLGPGEVERHMSKRPVLFYLEDPWGKYRLSPDSAAWNGELARVLPRAGSGVYFVITSRSDVVTGAGEILRRLDRWVVRLEAEQYGPTQRRRLFDNRRKRLTPEVQLLASRNRSTAMGQLQTPLEIERWFIALEQGRKDDETQDEFAARALHQAHRTNFEDVVADELSSREDGVWTPVLWALLKAQPALDRSVLTQVRRAVADRNPRLQSGLDALLNFLLGGRSLRQSGSAVSYAHPRVEAGFEQAMDRAAEESEDAIRAVLDALLAFDAGGGGDWGRDCAVRIVAAGEREAREKDRPSRVFVSPAGAVVLDDHLRSKVQTCGAGEFHEWLRLTADAGTTGSRVAELARWLLELPDLDEPWGFLRTWRAPSRPDAWYAWVKEDGMICGVLDRFIRISLVFEQGDYPASFYDDLGAFGFDLAAAFRAAAGDLIHRGYDGRAQAVVEGALRDLDAATPLALEAARLQAKLSDDWRGPSREIALPAINGHYNGDAFDHHDNDEGYVAGQILERYVPRLRAERGWRALDTSAVADGALYEWKKALEAQASSRRSRHELRAFGAHARGGSWESDAIRLEAKSLSRAAAERLGGRLSDRDVSFEVWSATVDALVAEPAVLATLQRGWLSQSDLARVFTLHWSLLQPGRAAGAAAGAAPLARRLRSELPSELRELVGDLRGAKRPWSSEAGKLARELAPLWPVACLDLVRTAERHGVRAEVAISAGLDGWDWEDHSVPPALADLVIDAGWRDLYTQLSLHPLAAVRRVALRARWRSGALPLDEVASLIRDDESSLVQRMLAQELAVEPKPEFLESLLSLAANTWADHSTSPGEPAQYPIARLAADALTEIPVIPDGKVRKVFETAFRTDDRQVRWLLLMALGVRGSDRARERLGVFVVNPQRRPSHRLAVADATALVAEHLGQGSIPAPSVAAIVGAPAALAVALTRLLAQTATPAQLVHAAKEMNATASHRVLLLLLNGRCDPALGEELAQLLPERHPARRLLQRPKAKSRLPRASVDDLGDVLLVEAVRQALDDRFEPELRASSPSPRRTRRRRRAPWRGFVRSPPPMS